MDNFINAYMLHVTNNEHVKSRNDGLYASVIGMAILAVCHIRELCQNR